MNPNKVIRKKVKKLTDLPNIGKAIGQYLHKLEIHEPSQLIGKSPYKMYEDLCIKDGVKYDLCLLDTFISITSFMEGGEPQPWWKFTKDRKKTYK